jgi:hypothetical protein
MRPLIRLYEPPFDRGTPVRHYENLLKRLLS